MGIPEVNALADSGGLKKRNEAWGIFLLDHTQAPDYQTVLENVPPWGQGLLLDLHGHHPESFNHSLRVATMVSKILSGEQGGQDAQPDLIQTVPNNKITLSALLHDVGKRQVPLAVLDSSRIPTPEEWEQVQQHAVIGFEEINPYDSVVAQIVGGHHMHQGQRSYGYPGAEDVGADIIAARTLVAAADVADALGSRRAYKPEMPPEQVREIMMGEGNFHKKLIDRVVQARFFGSAPFVVQIGSEQPVNDAFSPRQRG